MSFAGWTIFKQTDCGSAGWHNAQFLQECLSVQIGHGFSMDINQIQPAFDARPEYALLVSTLSAWDSETRRYYGIDWTDGKSRAEYRPDKILDKLYQFLISIGYEMSDEEKALQDGSHALFNDEAVQQE